MATRTLTLTRTLLDAALVPIAGAPVTAQILSPGNAQPVDTDGATLSLLPVPTTTDGAGRYSLAIVYPGDIAVPIGCRIRVVENGVVVDSPAGFAYAASIDVSTWYGVPSIAGLVKMRHAFDTAANVPIAGKGARVSISQLAVNPTTGVTISATLPVGAVYDSQGTAYFSLNPTGALDRATVYRIDIDGEQEPLCFIAPATADNYRGAYAAGTYNAGDVTSSGGVLYRANSTTATAPPGAAWAALPSGGPGSLPTDLITAHLTGPAQYGTQAIDQTNIAHLVGFATQAGDPVPSPISLADDTTNLIYRVAHPALTDATASATGVVLVDAVPGSGHPVAATKPTTDALASAVAGRVAKAGDTMTGELAVPDLSVSGLAGSVAGARYVGGTVGGAPTTGAHLLGDWATDQAGRRWTCTAAGTPGTWAQEPGTGGGGSILDASGKVPQADLTAWGHAFVDPTRADNQLLYRKAAAATNAVAIGMIGDSISAQGSPTAPATAASLLSVGGVAATMVNRAVSGTTTADWAPGGTRLVAAEAAFAAAGVRAIMITIGTNDADNAAYGSPRTAAQFYTDLSAILGYLVPRGYLILLNYPPYLVPGGLGGLVTSASGTALIAYQQQMAALAVGGQVFLGATDTYDYFFNNQGYYTDGIHLTQAGYNQLGAIYARAWSPLARYLAAAQVLAPLALGSGLSITPAGGGSPALLVAAGAGGGGHIHRHAERIVRAARAALDIGRHGLRVCESINRGLSWAMWMPTYSRK